MDARRFTDRAKIRVNFLTVSLVVDPPSNITPGFYPGRVRGPVVNEREKLLLRESVLWQFMSSL